MVRRHDARILGDPRVARVSPLTRWCGSETSRSAARVRILTLGTRRGAGNAGVVHGGVREPAADDRA